LKFFLFFQGFEVKRFAKNTRRFSPL